MAFIFILFLLFALLLFFQGGDAEKNLALGLVTGLRSTAQATSTASFRRMLVKLALAVITVSFAVWVVSAQ